jgi:hypothetical protein
MKKLFYSKFNHLAVPFFTLLALGILITTHAFAAPTLGVTTATIYLDRITQSVPGGDITVAAKTVSSQPVPSDYQLRTQIVRNGTLQSHSYRGTGGAGELGFIIPASDFDPSKGLSLFLEGSNGSPLYAYTTTTVGTNGNASFVGLPTGAFHIDNISVDTSTGDITVVSTIPQNGTAANYSLRLSQPGGSPDIITGGTVASTSSSKTITYTVPATGISSGQSYQIDLMDASQAETFASTNYDYSTSQGGTPPPSGGTTVTQVHANPIFGSNIPTVSCTATDCTFTVKYKADASNTISESLVLLPKADHDNAGTQQLIFSNQYQVTGIKNKTATATATISLNDLKQKMDASGAPDRNYYIAFGNDYDATTLSYMKYYDFGTNIPMSPASPTNPTNPTNPTTSSIQFAPTSILVPSTTATIKGDISLSQGTTATDDIEVWLAPSGGTVQKIKSIYSGAITTTPIPVTFTLTGLTSATYDYRIVAKTGTVDLYDNSFSTSTSSDQAAVTTVANSTDNGKCGTAIDSPQATAPTTTPELCTQGTPPAAGVDGTGPWTWTCKGINNGQDTFCTANTLASAAAGAKCGAADQTTRTDAPSAIPDLCTDGTAGTVSSTDLGWSWMCTKDSDHITCTTTKGDPANPDGVKKLADNFLQNPFKSLDSFPKIIKAVVNNIVLPIAIPFIGVMLIYSGMLFVIARRSGNVDGIARAKSTLIYTLIGATLVLGSFVIANALQGTLNSIVSSIYQHTNITRV